MFWQEKSEDSDQYIVPERIIDVVYKINCKTIPVDHLDSLSQEIIQHLPWVEFEEGAGVHPIHVAESANGWIRPDGKDDIMNVSKRTKMTLRIPSERWDDAQSLIGKELNINGHSLVVGSTTKKILSKMTTIFARYIETFEDEEESEFLKRMQKELLDKNIRIKKMMSGLIVKHHFSDSEKLSRKLMLSDLEVEESVLLQEEGLNGCGSRAQGFGLFIPHKGIDAVNKSQDK